MATDSRRSKMWISAWEPGRSSPWLGRAAAARVRCSTSSRDSGSRPAVTFGCVESFSNNRLGHFSYMPQRDLLLPWRSALDNAALTVQVQGASRSEGRASARAMLEELGLAGFAGSRPSELSGGMRQRIALIRTFLPAQDVLLDEPFGALDAITRGELQEWLLKLHGVAPRSVLLVTHDLEEAVFLADRVYILSPRPGRILTELRVDLPRPRTLDITATAEFSALKYALMLTLRRSRQGDMVPA